MSKLKVARPVYRYDWFCGKKSFSSSKEKALAQDEMHKPYVRAKRNANNLPNSWSDTKFIPRVRNWKHRCKKRKQWIKHILTRYEKFLLNLISWEEYYD